MAQTVVPFPPDVDRVCAGHDRVSGRLTVVSPLVEISIDGQPVAAVRPFGQKFGALLPGPIPDGAKQLIVRPQIGTPKAVSILPHSDAACSGTTVAGTTATSTKAVTPAAMDPVVFEPVIEGSSRIKGIVATDSEKLQLRVGKNSPVAVPKTLDSQGRFEMTVDPKDMKKGTLLVVEQQVDPATTRRSDPPTEVQAAKKTYPPVITEELEAGKQRVPFHLNIDTDAVSVFDNGVKIAGAEVQINHETGDGSAALGEKSKLKAGHLIYLETSDGARSASVTVKDTPVALKVRFSSTPREGQSTIFAVATVPPSGTDAFISVYVNGDRAELIDGQNNGTRELKVPGTGSAALLLRQPLEAGQCVSLVEYRKAEELLAVEQHQFDCTTERTAEQKEARAKSALSAGLPEGQVASSLVDPFFDFGRVRAYFAGGAVLSQNGDNFTRQDVFLAFNMDKNWLWGGPLALRSIMPKHRLARVARQLLEANAQGGVVEEPNKRTTLRQPYRRLMFDTFFEARLTAIPVSTIDCSSDKYKNLSACTNETGQKSDTVPASTKQTESFISTRKAASLQGGAYMPYIVTTWMYKRSPFALSAGPIAKVGFITPTDILTQNSRTVVRELTDQNFYKYYSFGSRLGLHQMSYSQNVSPELIAYMDVGIGRFSNLTQTYSLQRMFDGKPYTETYSTRPWRLHLEGLFKVPSYPFVLGFSANVGQNLQGGINETDPRFKGFKLLSSDPPKDDLRFFFGTKFDLGQLMGKLKGPVF